MAKTKNNMECLAVYGDRKTNRRVQVFNIETLDTGSRIHYRYGSEGKDFVMGRKAFKREFYNVAGVVV